jgi:hypothetical protein
MELYDLVDYVFDNVLPKTSEAKREEFVELLANVLVDEGVIEIEDDEDEDEESFDSED